MIDCASECIGLDIRSGRSTTETREDLRHDPVYIQHGWGRPNHRNGCVYFESVLRTVTQSGNVRGETPGRFLTNITPKNVLIQKPWFKFSDVEGGTKGIGVTITRGDADKAHRRNTYHPIVMSESKSLQSHIRNVSSRSVVSFIRNTQSPDTRLQFRERTHRAQRWRAWHRTH